MGLSGGQSTRDCRLWQRVRVGARPVVDLSVGDSGGAGDGGGVELATAARFARQFIERQWQVVETGIDDIHAAMLAALPPQRAAALLARVMI